MDEYNRVGLRHAKAKLEINRAKAEKKLCEDEARDPRPFRFVSQVSCVSRVSCFSGGEFVSGWVSGKRNETQMVRQVPDRMPERILGLVEGKSRDHGDQYEHDEHGEQGEQGD